MARGNTSARGYGTQHQQLRRALAPRVATGRVPCSRCGQPIAPGSPWDLDHTDDRTTYHGPAHRHCNRSAGGRKAHTREVSIEW